MKDGSAEVTEQAQHGGAGARRHTQRVLSGSCAALGLMIGHIIVDGGPDPRSQTATDTHGMTRTCALATCRGTPRWMRGMRQIKTALPTSRFDLPHPPHPQAGLRPAAGRLRKSALHIRIAGTRHTGSESVCICVLLWLSRCVDHEARGPASTARSARSVHLFPRVNSSPPDLLASCEIL